ncbi:MAG: hypothetical protein ACU826_06485 [Gammaproteobacteria bacterium]
MNNEDVIQATLNFAIGMERLLKGILFDINPTYILLSPEFKHSLKVLYEKKVINCDDSKSVLEMAPTTEVITFRNSLLRATAVSYAAQKNKNRLFGLSNIRDIIVHNNIELIDYSKARLLLQRDFYFLILDFVDEFKFIRANFFGESEDSLIEISKQHKQDIENVIRLKIEEHCRIWIKIKNNAKEVRNKTIITDELLESEHSYETTCPACNQRAVLISEPDFVVDLETSEKKEVGEFVKIIKCLFCGLIIDDGIELDVMGYGKSFDPYFDFDDDIPF